MNFLVDKNISLQEFLKKKFPDCSNRTIASWIKNERILIDGKPTKKNSHYLTKDQNLTFLSKEKILHSNIKLIYEDSFFLIVEKPTNILSVPLDTPNSINVLKILRSTYNTKNIFAVHRIDKETSGLLVYTKSFIALEKLKEIFKRHDIKRKYFAIVEGFFPENEGKWESYLKEDQDLKVRSAPKEEGLLAITHFKTLYQNKNYSFLSLTLETGKKHQIRVQLAERGFPVVGDKRYGSDVNPIKRMALHAYLLEFSHPFTKKKMSFFSPLPKDFFSLGADKIKDLL
jgi:23S rRNA pseudouridine1911/1915/1917 synthase